MSISSDTSSLITVENKLFIWGNNDHAQQGNGTNTGTVVTPTLLSLPAWNNKTIKHIEATRYTTSLVLEESSSIDKLYMWGADQYGQQGNGSTLINTITTPALIDGAWGDTTIFKLIY